MISDESAFALNLYLDCRRGVEQAKVRKVIRDDSTRISTSIRTIYGRSAISIPREFDYTSSPIRHFHHPQRLAQNGPVAHSISLSLS